MEYIKERIKCSKLRVIVRSNITKSTSKKLCDFYDYFDNKFGDDHRFSLFIRPVRDAGGESVKVISDDLLSNDEFDEIMLSMAKFSKDGKISFNGNYSELEPAGFICPAMCKGKYTITVDGKVSKCDSAEDNIHIGYLDTNGNLILEGTYEEDWMTGCFKYKEECEECFFNFIKACSNANVIALMVYPFDFIQDESDNSYRTIPLTNDGFVYLQDRLDSLSLPIYRLDDQIGLDELYNEILDLLIYKQI